MPSKKRGGNHNHIHVRNFLHNQVVEYHGDTDSPLTCWQDSWHGDAASYASLGLEVRFPVCLIKPALGCKLWGREKPRPENFCSGKKQFSEFPRQVGMDVKGNTAPQWIMGKKEAGLKSAEILSKRRRVKLAWVKIEFQELTIPWAKFRGSGKASKGKLFECI